MTPRGFVSFLFATVHLVVAQDPSGRCWGPNFSCGKNVPCCSKYGYCGATAEYCAPENCQANCWSHKTAALQKGQHEKAAGSIVADDPNLTKSQVGVYRKHKSFPEEALGVYVRCIDPGAVALTFDDGPSHHTKRLLDVLDQEGVKATFFILTRNLDPVYTRHYAEHQQTLRETVKRGHLIGSHSYNHPNFVNIGLHAVEADMSKAEAFFQNVLGFRPRIMRPPEGAINKSVADLLHRMGYFIVNWSHDTNDWKHAARDPERPLRYVKSRVPVKPDNPFLSESVILLQHDTYEPTVENQAAVIRNLKAKGYRFVMLDECIGLERPYRK